MWATPTPSPGDLQDQRERLPREAQAPRLLLHPAPAVSPVGAQGQLSDPRPGLGSFRPEVWGPVSQLLALKVGVVSCGCVSPPDCRQGQLFLGWRFGERYSDICQACPRPHMDSPPLGVQCRSEEFFQCRCRTRCPGKR